MKRRAPLPNCSRRVRRGVRAMTLRNRGGSPEAPARKTTWNSEQRYHILPPLHSGNFPRKPPGGSPGRAARVGAGSRSRTEAHIDPPRQHRREKAGPEGPAVGRRSQTVEGRNSLIALDRGTSPPEKRQPRRISPSRRRAVSRRAPARAAGDRGAPSRRARGAPARPSPRAATRAAAGPHPSQS